MRHHKLKEGVWYNKRITKRISQDTFVHHVSMWNKDSLKLFDFVYLNKLFVNSDSKDNKYPIQSSLKSQILGVKILLTIQTKHIMYKFKFSVGDADLLLLKTITKQHDSICL